MFDWSAMFQVLLIGLVILIFGGFFIICLELLDRSGINPAWGLVIFAALLFISVAVLAGFGILVV